MKLPISSLLILILSYSIPNYITAQNIVKKVKEISDDTSESYEEIDKVLNNLFDRVETAIKEADDVNKFLSKKLNKGEDLSLKERKVLSDKVRKIHKVYKSVSDDRDKYDRYLNNYDRTFDMQKRGLGKLIEDKNSHLNSMISEKEHLLGKSNRTDIEEDNLNSLENKISIINGTIDYLLRFQSQMKDVEGKISNIEDVVARFLNQMKNGTETTALMVEYLEISGQLEQAINNAERISKLNELTKEVARSLQNLSQSIEKLERTADVL